MRLTSIDLNLGKHAIESILQNVEQFLQLFGPCKQFSDFCFVVSTIEVKGILFVVLTVLKMTLNNSNSNTCFQKQGPHFSG